MFAYCLITRRSTLFGNPEDTLLPNALTSIRVPRTPFSIRYDLAAKARDNDSRRALLAEMFGSPAYANSCILDCGFELSNIEKRLSVARALSVRFA